MSSGIQGLLGVAKGQGNRLNSLYVQHEQSPFSSSRNLDMSIQEDSCQKNPAAYFAATPWRFSKYENSSSPLVHQSSSNTLPRSRNGFSIIPSHHASLWNKTPPMSQHVRLQEDHMSSPQRDLDIGCSSVPRVLENEGSSEGRSTPLVSSSRIQNSSMASQSAVSEVLDDESDDFMDEEEFAAWIAQQHQEKTRRPSIDTENKAIIRRKSSVIVPRNPPITYPFESLSEYTYNGARVSPKSFVELQDEDFMKIVYIVRDKSTSDVTIRGYIYRRTREMNGLLDKKRNEVCWILHVDDDDPRDPLIQGIETRPVFEVVRRRNIRLTNMEFPALSFRDEVKETEETITNHRVLVCRYKYLCVYPNAKARHAYAWCEKGFHRIRADECDKRADNNMADNDLRQAWRGDTQPGGAREGWLNGEKEYIRQEAISNRGTVSWQSLKAPNGPDFPKGDPMTRGSVGLILNKSDISTEPVRRQKEINIDLPQSSNKTRNTDEIQELVSPSVRALQQSHRQPQSRSPLSTFNRLAGAPNLDDADDVSDLFDLSRSLRKSSIGAPRARRISPQVVEIDAQVKTSSSAGIFEKHYEGKITSKFIPSPISKRKRSGEGSFDVYGKRSKTPRTDSWDNLNKSRYPRDLQLYGDDSRRAGPSDSERSQLEESVEELWVAPKARGPHPTDFGLLTPLSPRSNDPLRSSSHIDHRDSRSRPEQSPCHNHDMDGVVDLTAPQARPSSRFQSEFRQSSSLAPELFKSQLNTFCSPLSASSPPLESNHPKPVSKVFSSGLLRASNLTRMKSRSSSPGSHSMSHIKSYNSLAERITPHPKRERLTSQTPTPGRPGQIKSENTIPSKGKPRRYTFGDCFCGAGGMSRGAVNAGLRIDWGFDFWETACQTYAMNFFGTPIYNVWANEFADGKGHFKVDICHLSPPCQFFSDAHTIQGKDDDMNTASLFAIFNLLEKAKPRVVTLEQTSGLIRRHPIFFNAVVNMFTARGFSVRWRVMNCADFGLPQRRMRLFIIASW